MPKNEMQYVDSRDLPARPSGVKMFGTDEKSRAYNRERAAAVDKSLRSGKGKMSAIRAAVLREGD